MSSTVKPPSLNRTSSKADTSLRRTVPFSPPGPILKETLIAQLLQSGHLSKADKSFCPASVRFREVSLY